MVFFIHFPEDTQNAVNYRTDGYRIIFQKRQSTFLLLQDSQHKSLYQIT